MMKPKGSLQRLYLSDVRLLPVQVQSHQLWCFVSAVSVCASQSFVVLLTINRLEESSCQSILSLLNFSVVRTFSWLVKHFNRFLLHQANMVNIDAAFLLICFVYLLLFLLEDLFFISLMSIVECVCVLLQTTNLFMFFSFRYYNEWK